MDPIRILFVRLGLHLLRLAGAARGYFGIDWLRRIDGHPLYLNILHARQVTVSRLSMTLLRLIPLLSMRFLPLGTMTSLRTFSRLYILTRMRDPSCSALLQWGRRLRAAPGELDAGGCSLGVILHGCRNLKTFTPIRKDLQGCLT